MATWKTYIKDRGDKGFTMLEVLLVLVILMVMYTVASPYFTGHRQKIYLNEAAQALMEDLKLTRQTAVTKNTNYEITYNFSDNKVYIINTLDSAGNVTATRTKTLINSQYGIAFTDDGMVCADFKFYSRGTCSDECTMVLTNSLNQTRQIRTSVTGKVSVQ